ncbi:hypothetical protein KP509_04G024700 [Ceratopteris richardii]|uniref:Uncharacterized protein n=1 Tax=Ceratopteris richardii TaxID=49495 RepID=A0A8T2UVD6_CERRI|nr:hypothetical protein KP509_04G024700 [Ceratopteris richardii]
MWVGPSLTLTTEAFAVKDLSYRKSYMCFLSSSDLHSRLSLSLSLSLHESIFAQTRCKAGNGLHACRNAVSYLYKHASIEFRSSTKALVFFCLDMTWLVTKYVM